VRIALTIVAHLATIAAAVAGGGVSLLEVLFRWNEAVAADDVHCIYVIPLGAVCSGNDALRAFPVGAVITAASIYTVWGGIVLLSFWRRRRNQRAKEQAMLEVFDGHIPL
jgi:hypothetical protein